MFDFLSKKFSSLFSSNKTLSSDNIQSELKNTLLEADVPLEIVSEFAKKIAQRIENAKKSSKDISPEEILRTCTYQELVSLLGDAKTKDPLELSSGKIIFLGLQGAGKTTTIAKVGRWISDNKNIPSENIISVSLDFQRPAAVEQLKIMSEKANIRFISPEDTSITNTIKKALSEYDSIQGKKFLLVDSAGRLNIDVELMAELKDICAQLKPNKKILVLDSMTGQQSLTIAKDFKKEIDFDSAILTKMDSDSRAGAALSLRWATEKPISFIANGEKVDNLEPFITERIASRIVGSGDVQTLSEKLESKINKSKNQKGFKAMTDRTMSGNLTLEDFLAQIKLMNSMGSMKKVMSYLPGMGNINASQINQGEIEISCFKSIIESMTPKERHFPKILDKSRRRRISNGSGRSMKDIDRLIEKFEQTRRFAKILGRFGS